MKKLFGVILLLSCPCWAQWALKNSNESNGTGGAATFAATAFTSALTNPSITGACVFDDANSGATYTVTDTATNTYADVGPGKVLINSSARIMQCFLASNTHTTASNVLTMHISTGTLNFPRMVVFEFTGGATSSPIDGGLNVGYSSNPNAQNATTGANVLLATALVPVTSGDLIISGFATTSANMTVGTSPNAFTSIGIGANLGVEYFVQTSAASITPTAGDTSTDNYANITVALKPPAGAAVTNKPHHHWF
jgi:hypothetical protein